MELIAMKIDEQFPFSPFDYRSLSHLLSEHEWAEEYGWVKADYFSMSCIFNVSMKEAWGVSLNFLILTYFLFLN